MVPVYAHVPVSVAVAIPVSFPIPVSLTIAVSVSVTSAEASDALAGRAFDAGFVLGELVLSFAQLLLVMGANFAVFVLELIERLADDVELIDLTGDCEDDMREMRRIRTTDD